MNWVDLIIIGAVVLAGVIGYRVGLVTRALSWLGLAAGVLLGVGFLSAVLDAVPSSSSRIRLLVALGFIIGLAIIGQSIGLAVAALAQAKITLGPKGERVDRALGAAVGVVAVLAAVWLITPLAVDRGTSANREVRESTVVRAVGNVAPKAPNVLDDASDSFRRAFPDIVDRGKIQDAGPPPSGALPPTADGAATAATVKVEGEACGKIQDGSGWVVERGLVVTNAHVVAGEKSTSVITVDGTKHKAAVIAFDPAADLAVLRAPTLKAAPLPMAAATADDVGVFYGFPGGGALTRQPGRVATIVESTGKDIYGRPAPNRRILVVAAKLAPGDSGGPFVRPDGTVGGVAFAIDPDKPSTAFALTIEDVKKVLVGAGPTPVSTQGCTPD